MSDRAPRCNVGRGFTPDLDQFGLRDGPSELDWKSPCPGAVEHALVLDFEQVVSLCCPHMHAINAALNQLDEKRRIDEENRITRAQLN